jgi:hexosaminidase
MDPCWIYRAAPLDGISRIDVRVAPLPFNFQLGHDARNVVTHPMWSLYGELEIHLDGCSGPLLAALRLPKHSPGQPPQALSARLKPQSGSHDLCFLLAAPRDPLWALDSVQLSGNPPGQ